jgi:hypothetical protein
MTGALYWGLTLIGIQFLIWCELYKNEMKFKYKHSVAEKPKYQVTL